MDDRRKDDAVSCFSGWWRSWPLLAAAGRDAGRSRTESDLDESAHFLIWAAELAAQRDGPRPGD